MTEECLTEWSRAETDNGVPYYINQVTQSVEWDHPMMKNIMRTIEGCNAIRYASYRTAAKMQILQRELHMKQVHLDLIAGVFERHRLSITENSVTLDATEIEDVLSDIFFAARKETSTNFDVDLATKLGVNFILNIFDKQRKGAVSVFSTKVALTLISNSRLQDKYSYLYQQLADHNACLSRAALHTLLTNICKITEMLGESMAYGCNQVQSHIDNCFLKSEGCLGVSEVEFATWIMQEPPLLVWISTLNRMKFAEDIIHNIKCSSCKITPVQGPRYSCLRCAGYHQCQGCFLLGKTSSKHKLKHPVREYCVKTSNRELTKLIVELIRNKLRLCPTGVVMAASEEPPPDTIHDGNKASDTISVRSTVRRKVLNDPQKELQSIISHLEEENKQLQVELLELCGSRAERLQRHRATVESQLQRLKILKKYLFLEPPRTAQTMNRMQSTPMIHPVTSRISALPLEFELSPIVRQGTIENRKKRFRQAKSRFTPDEFTTSSTITQTMESEQFPPGNSQVTSGLNTITENTRIDLSTWIGGGGASGLTNFDSGFSQWLRGDKSSKLTGKSNSHSETPQGVSHSPVGRDNTPSSLQRPDKHSQHSSLQNIQGDLNDILDRLQNMVANDCLLEESLVANDNCELKRATTEMEDLLTGLIEGMESRKSKLTTIV